VKAGIGTSWRTVMERAVETSGLLNGVDWRWRQLEQFPHRILADADLIIHGRLARFKIALDRLQRSLPDVVGVDVCIKLLDAAYLAQSTPTKFVSCAFAVVISSAMAAAVIRYFFTAALPSNQHCRGSGIAEPRTAGLRNIVATTGLLVAHQLAGPTLR
jgi:hypothetical protein